MSYFSLPLKTFSFTGNMKTERGRAALPDREVESAVWPTHRQQCLLRNETQQQRHKEETAVKGRRTVRDPKLGKIIIWSMMAKIGFQQKLSCTL